MDNFVNRLEFLLQHYEFTASTFADKIGVQRSSLSHLLSGRNKPSLDFIMKIYEAFPELNLYWLLKGEGVFSEENAPTIAPVSPSLFSEQPIEKETTTPIETPKIAEQLFTEVKSIEAETPLNTEVPEKKISEEKTTVVSGKIDIKKICPTKEIEQIVIFYKDGSFSGYFPNSSESGS